MADWLTPLKKGFAAAGFLGLSQHHMREIISEGADMVMKQKRTDLIPQFHNEVPSGVAIINNAESLEIYLAGMISASVRMREWQTMRFAFPAKGFSGIEYTPPWRALINGLARHDCHPILIPERDVYVFGGLDWHVGNVKIGVGLG